ncbi:MAG TPA: ABC transporter permease [Phototrophicaceae bacterium]|nr:ABC transporter permease [Phototrophicaceae bacterium]
MKDRNLSTSSTSGELPLARQGVAVSIARPDKTPPRQNRARRLLRRLTRDPLSTLGGVLILLILIVALVGPAITPYNPVKADYSVIQKPPSAQHLFGTDELGRDVLTRVIYGSQISLIIAIAVNSVSAFIGLMVGGLAGYWGGAVDEILMRITDIFQSFPWLLFAIAIALVIGPNLINSMLVLSLIWWPGYARLVRGQVLAARSYEFVEAAQSLGASHARIFFYHILPTAFGPYVVMLTIGAGRMILATSTLSFVGLGAQPPTPEWGAMVADGRTLLFNSWWISTFPGIAILITAVGFNLVGDSLRDLLDPHSSVR